MKVAKIDIGAVYMTREPRNERVLIFEEDDFSFLWTKSEIRKVQTLWNEGRHIADIADEIERDQDEIAMLIIWLARHGRLRKREGGVLGHEIS